jgi:WD40 repeat protein
MVKLQHRGEVIPSSGRLSRVQSLAWSTNGRKLAVVLFPNTLHLYDEAGAKRDKIPPRPRETGGAKTFVVNAVAFSQDSCLLAVAQSDGILFVYKVRCYTSAFFFICSQYGSCLKLGSFAGYSLSINHSGRAKLYHSFACLGVFWVGLFESPHNVFGGNVLNFFLFSLRVCVRRSEVKVAVVTWTWRVGYFRI